MTSAAYSAHPALTITADVFLPALGALTVILPTLAWRAGRIRRPGILWACGLVSIAMIYLVRFVNLKAGTLAGMGVHFSSHTAVAISFGVTLVAFRLSLLPGVMAAVCGYLWLITYLPYHTATDVFYTTAIILPLSVVCHVPWWKRNVGKPPA